MSPCDSYAYKVERDGKSVVYATDASYNDLAPEALDAYVKFYESTDALISDSHFGDLIEPFEKTYWGAFIGVDIELNASVKRLILVHHDHLSDDKNLTQLKGVTHNYPQHVADKKTARSSSGTRALS